MLDYFSKGKYIQKFIKRRKEKKEKKEEDGTLKKCTAPFSGWGGPLQVPSKIIFTIGDFFGCLVCVAFILHVIILLGTHGTAETSKNPNRQTYNKDKTHSRFRAIFNYVAHEITGRESDNDEIDDHYGAVSCSLFFMWIFGLNFANLAIIPIFIFTRFSYFSKGGGPLQPVLRAIYSPLTFIESNKISRHILAAFYLVYFVVFVIYAIAAYLGGSSWAFTGLDKMLLGVVVVIPVARIVIVLVAYSIHSWISFFYSVTCNRNRLLRIQRIKSMRALPKIPLVSTTTKDPVENEEGQEKPKPPNQRQSDEEDNLDSIDNNNDTESNTNVQEEISGVNAVETDYVFTSNNNNNNLIGQKINNYIETKSNQNKIPDHDNMNSIHSITFDGGFDSPFDYCPKFARADPFLYSIYGQSTLCTWHCSPDGRTNSWSAAWELYHICVAIATCIYIIYVGSKSGQCNSNCIGFIFTFILVVIPLTIRVRFPFFVIHSAFSCIPQIDDLFECFGCCKCFAKHNSKGCGCDCDCKCQQCMSNTFNKCCNKGSENLSLNENEDDFSMEEVYASDEEDAIEDEQSESIQHHRHHKKDNSDNGNQNATTNNQNNNNNNDDADEFNTTVINNGESANNSRVNMNKYYRRRRTSELQEKKEDRKVFKNFELLALSSKGLGVMSAVIYLIIIAIMLIVTVFILSNFAFDNRVYGEYNLNMTKYREGQTKGQFQGQSRTYGTLLSEITQPISEMCYVRPLGLTMLQYFLLADLCYYDVFSEGATAAIKEFFPPSEINISSMGQMDLHEYSFGSMTYFNFDAMDLSVVAIRGSTEGVDWALDIQFFLSSALLTISAPLNIFARDDTPRTMRSIRLILAYPLHLMEKFTLFYKFYDDLMSYYETIPLKSNVVFVGHSLGGGLSKLFGHVKGKAAISVSGPGITLFQTIKKGARKDIFSLLSETDIVPDSDLVPRVEQTAATRYRILCNQGFGTCHFVKHTLCMAGIMCNTPHENFCTSFTDSKISELYEKMVNYASEQ